MSYQIEYFNANAKASLDAWPVGLKARYLALLMRMTEHGPDLGMPHTRAMGNGLFEVRVKAGEGIGRAFYCTMVGKRIVVLHGFIKKTDKTPAKEMAIAHDRLKELKS
ncbi:type II toxin-antitoxin system RelE/ParE family toxin [Rhodoferax sp.]|uniref:type II toxin-antitoxin system RelE/ParE family toxin n=1 Tax=Rhodoferax sp. TaxID=50421 RepID=UPI0025DE8C67|nr:type II toxin-antitoxin system RelE/ParE family toxin [Rhodoferax sp.]